jgi:hypothetical protein
MIGCTHQFHVTIEKKKIHVNKDTQARPSLFYGVKLRFASDEGASLPTCNARDRCPLKTRSLANVSTLKGTAQIPAKISF